MLTIVQNNQESYTLHQVIEALQGQWCEDTLLPFTPPMRRNMEKWLSDGITQEVISAAIEQTAVAPRPSWVYLQSIMHRCSLQGIFTLQQFTSCTRKKQAEAEKRLRDTFGI